MLKKLRSKRQLAVIQAEQAVLDEYDNELSHEENPDLKELAKEDKCESMDRFLNSQIQEVTPPPKLEVGQPPVTSTCEASSPPIVGRRQSNR